ncbi:hypothetical protein ACFXOL_31895 [Streptomyces californicus]|uniref:hypothetical protein n=1 Tax=Streptomyces californicus TaxID=67351 RepID=UPI003665B14B
MDDLPDINNYWTREGWVEAILDYQTPREDLDAPTDEERRAKYGDNWREVYTLTCQMATLTHDEAERIALNRMTEDDYDALYERVKAAAPESWAELFREADPEDYAVDFKYRQAEIFWEIRYHYTAAQMAAVAGDSIPKKLHDEAMWAWTHR